MTIQACSLCSGEVLWDDSASSAVCVDCGNLEDVSQTTLTNQQDFDPTGNTNYRKHDIFQAFADPTLRAASGRILAGQSSKSKNYASNLRAMHDYITSLLRNLRSDGLAERAHHLFDLTMYQANYRFGRQARLAAGACIFIAMNESRKGDTLASIAALLSETIPSVAKVYTRVTKLLDVQVQRPDPALLLPSLQAHVTKLLKAPSKLTTKLHNFLAPLPPQLVLQLATQLSTLISTLIPASELSSRVACAVYLLAVEGIAGQPSPDVQQLAEVLGERFGGSGSGSSKWSVMTRYNFLLPTILQWRNELPWLQHAAPGKKVVRKADRIEVAKALRDIVQFREQLDHARRLSNLNAVEIPKLHVDGDDFTNHQEPAGPPLRSVLGKRHRSDGAAGANEGSSSDKPLQFSRTLVRARSAAFLLSPRSAIHPRQPKSVQDPSCRPTGYEKHLVDQQTKPSSPPTRLQRLQSERDSLADISDDDLFEEGELEGMLRADREVELLSIANGWESHRFPSKEGEAIPSTWLAYCEDERSPVDHVEGLV